MYFGTLPAIAQFFKGNYNLPEIRNGNNRQRNILDKTLKAEGGYVDDPNLIDQPTDSGITQKTLDNYRTNHPKSNFPANVKDLKPAQIDQIYIEDYHDERRIGDIKNQRIAYAIYDMGVMSNFNNVGTMVQTVLNKTENAGLKVDGIIGTKTINALNNISDTNHFMTKLKEDRLRYLRGLNGWNKYGNGWTRRTKKY